MTRQTKFAWPNTFRQARFIPAVEYIQANRLRRKLLEEMNERMKDIDAVICPSFTGSQLTLTNLTGHPAVVLPNGFTDKGTPVSITFFGQLGGEAKLLAVSNIYQDATPHHLKHPTLSKSE